MKHYIKNIQIDNNTYLNKFDIDQNNLTELLNKITNNNTILSINYENNTLSIYTENPINLNKFTSSFKINNTETMIPLINESTISLEELYEIHKRILNKIKEEIKDKIQKITNQNEYKYYLTYINGTISNSGIIIINYQNEKIATLTENDIIFKDKSSLHKMMKGYFDLYSFFEVLKDQLKDIFQKYSYLFHNKNKIVKSINSNLLIIITLEGIIIKNKYYDPLSFDSINIINDNKEKIVFNINDLAPEIKNERYELNQEKKEIINMLSKNLNVDTKEKISLAEIINILSKIEEPLSTYNICEVSEKKSIYLKIKNINNHERSITLYYNNLMLTDFIYNNKAIFFENKYSNEAYELMKNNNLLKKICFYVYDLNKTLLNEIKKEYIQEIMNNNQNNNEHLISINDLIQIIKKYIEEGFINKESLQYILYNNMIITSIYKKFEIAIFSTKLLYKYCDCGEFYYDYFDKKIDPIINDFLVEEIQKIGIEEFNSKLLIEKPYKLLEALEEEKKEKQKVNQKKRFGLFN